MYTDTHSQILKADHNNIINNVSCEYIVGLLNDDKKDHNA